MPSDLPYEGSLNDKEKDLFKQDIEVGAKALLAALEARDTANSRYQQGPPMNGGNGDAFRHALWNARMVRSVGPDWAKRWGDAHEEGAPTNKPIDKAMDLHNNRIGRDVGGRVNPGEMDLAGKVQDAVRRGWCRKIVNGKLANSDRQGEI